MKNKIKITSTVNLDEIAYDLRLTFLYSFDSIDV